MGCASNALTLRYEDQDGRLYEGRCDGHEGFFVELTRVLSNTLDWLDTQNVFHKAQES